MQNNWKIDIDLMIKLRNKLTKRRIEKLAIKYSKLYSIDEACAIDIINKIADYACSHYKPGKGANINTFFNVCLASKIKSYSYTERRGKFYSDKRVKKEICMCCETKDTCTKECKRYIRYNNYNVKRDAMEEPAQEISIKREEFIQDTIEAVSMLANGPEKIKDIAQCLLELNQTNVSSGKMTSKLIENLKDKWGCSRQYAYTQLAAFKKQVKDILN